LSEEDSKIHRRDTESAQRKYFKLLCASSVSSVSVVVNAPFIITQPKLDHYYNPLKPLRIARRSNTRVADQPDTARHTITSVIASHDDLSGCVAGVISPY
jgi:hypothetical protein